VSGDTGRERITREALTALAARVLMAAGATEAVATEVADALAEADAQGLGSHGVARLPQYAAQVRSGKVDGRARPTLTRSAEASVRVDARDGFAHPAIRVGLEAALGFVVQTGVAAVVIANSHHAGVAGEHVARAARRGALALGFSNSPAGIAPWGGHHGVFGTNPVAFACPRREAPPLVIDLSLSRVARGKVMLAAREGRPIPEGWALDASGRPTTDAEAALAGTMLPIGDAKGAALALMVEILTAALAGSNLGFEAGSFFTAEGPRPRIAQSFLLLHPGAFAGDAFPDRVETLLGAITSQPGCRLPGERRREQAERALHEGIVLPAGLLVELRRLAEA
jgi:(2R)-3-sulfolactate dehydrogenase (NADP+)